jgi:hypothetical protein
MNHSQLQRIERVLSAELARHYEDLCFYKNSITKFWERSVPDTLEGNSYFKTLNVYKNDYRRVLNNIKKLEETQRAIRKILRKRSF